MNHSNGVFSGFACTCLAFGCALLTGTMPARGANFYKADNNNPLSQGASWQGGTAPGATDMAAWNDSVSANNCTNLLGADVTWGGILIATNGPGADVFIYGANKITLGQPGSSSWTAINLTNASRNLTIAAPIALAHTNTWSVGTGRTLRIGGGITTATGANRDLWRINKAGAGTLVLSNASTLGAADGTTTNFLATGGTVAIGNDGAFGSGKVFFAGAALCSADANPHQIPNAMIIEGAYTLGAPSTGPLTFTGTNFLTYGDRTFFLNGDVTINGVITNEPYLQSSGIRSLVKGGASDTTLTLGNPNNGFGILRITNGVVAVTNIDGANHHSVSILGRGTNAVDVVFTNAANDSATLRILGSGTQTTTKFFALLTPVECSGVFDIVDPNAEVVFGGEISGEGSLLKTGAGTMTLNTNLAFSGRITNQAGTLKLTSLASLDSVPEVTIKSGATLAGEGTIAGQVNVQGVLAPGSAGSPGQLNCGSAVWSGAGAYVWRMTNAQGSAGNGWSFFNATNSLYLQATPLKPFVIRLQSLTASGAAGPADGFFPSASTSWVITHAGNLGNFNSNAFALDTTQFANDLKGGTFGLSCDGSNLCLTFAAAYLAPEIVRQPKNKLGYIGLDADFSVVAGGAAPLTYQWYANDAPLLGATNAALLVPNCQPAQDGARYFVVVTNNFGAVTSQVARLTVAAVPPPTMVGQPQSTNVFAGTFVDLFVIASSPVPLSYQWCFKDAPVSGATNSVLPLHGVTTNQAGPYYVIVANSAGSVTSQVATVQVYATEQAGLVAYYPFNGNAADASGHNLNGSVMGAQLGLDRFNAPLRAYEFQGTNSYLSFTNSPLTQTTNWSISAWIRPDSLAQQGMAVMVGFDNGYTGNGFGFGVCGSGGSLGGGLFGLLGGVGWVDSGYTFTSASQWHQVVMVREAGVVKFYVDGTLKPNTSALAPLAPTGFRIGSATGTRFFQGAVDEVRIYNRALAAAEVSQLLALEQEAAPVITELLTNQTVYISSNAAFTVSAAGSAPLGYQWFGNNLRLPDETNATLELVNCQLPQSGNAYFAVVTNRLGAATSSVATLTVVPFPLPTIVTQPVAVVAYPGDTASFSVGAENLLDLSYQWFFGSTPIGTGTNDILWLSDVDASQAGDYSVVVSNLSGSVTSQVARLTVLPVPVPTIVSHPVSTEGVLGGSASFSVLATNPAILHYQWFFSNAPIDGATNALLALSGITSNQAGPYYVVVSNKVGAVSSAVATLSVQVFERFGLVAHYPFSGSADDASGGGHHGTVMGASLVADRFGHEHQAYSFSDTNTFISFAASPLNSNDNWTVSAWICPSSLNQLGMALYLGTNGFPYVPGGLGFGLGGAYWYPGSNFCAIYGGSHVMDSGFTFTSTTDWHHAVMVWEAGTLKLYFDGIPSGTNFNVTPVGMGGFRIGGGAMPARFQGAVDEVRVYNRAFTAQEVQALKALESRSYPGIVQQPQNQVVYSGGTAAFQLEARGTTDLWYQWFANNQPMTGETNSALQISNCQLAQSGSAYFAVVTNSLGAITSQVATLTVLPVPVPTIVTQPVAAADYPGRLVNFSVGATSLAPLTYQWYFGSMAMAAGTNDVLWLSNIDASQAGPYSVVVANVSGSVTSQVATLTVLPFPLPTIVTQPVSTVVYQGGPASFSVGATSLAPVTYQWFFGSTAIAAGTNDVLRLSNVDASQVGPYSVVVANVSGSVTSQVAVLSLLPPLESGVVGYYPFSGNANDATTNANHGSIVGSLLTSDRFGLANQAYVFNGTSDYIGFSAVRLTQVTNWSVSAWLRPGSLSQQGVAVFVGADNGSTGNGYGFGVGSSGGTGNKLVALLGGVAWVDSGYTFTSTSQWHQVVMLQEGGVLKFYVDGAQTANTSTQVPLTPTAFRLGSATGLRYYQGMLDDVRLFNRALAAQEVAQLYSLESQSVPTNTVPSPVASFTRVPTNATTTVAITFNASGSTDAQGGTNLQYRWDWENDGNYDTAFSTNLIATHRYYLPGTKTAVLQVKDAYGATSVAADTFAVAQENDPGQPGSGNTPFEVPFVSTDVAFDPVRPYAYVSGYNNKTLVMLNLTNGLIERQFAFDWNPESITISPNGQKMYVALLTRAHSYGVSATTNYIAEFDLGQRVKTKEFEIRADPYDLAVTDGGILVVPGGSGQWTDIRTYRASTGEFLDAVSIYQMARVSLHPSQTAVYAADTASYPLDIRRFNFDPVTGMFAGYWDSPYHGDYAMSGNVWCPPGGTNVIVRGGVVFSSSAVQAQDMLYYRTLEGGSVEDVDFDVPHNAFFTVNSSNLCYYSIGDLKLLYSQPVAQGTRFVHAAAGDLYLALTSSTNTVFQRIQNPAQTEPIIIQQPISQNTAAGSNVAFSVLVRGAVPYSYQWFFSNAPIASATNAQLAINGVTANQVGPYYVVVTNAVGAVTSQVATLRFTSFELVGLVGYYPFTGNADDLSPLGNHGSVSGAVLTSDRFGTTNRAYNFSGSGTYIGFTNASLNQIDNWTVSAWVRPNSLSQNGMAVCVGSDNGSAGNGYSFGVSGGGDVGGSKLYALLSGVGWIDSGYVFTSTNDWHQVVVQRSSGAIRFYVDGQPTVNTSSLVPLAPTGLRLGSQTGTRYFNGALDEVRLYTRVLTAQEIQALYALETQTAPIISSQPQNQWAYAGSNAVFSVQAWGSQPMAYRWYQMPGGTGEPTLIGGATNATLQVLNCQAAQDKCVYFAVITNALGATTSQVATLSIVPFDLSGLVAHYPLDNSASDASGHGWSGTLQNVAGVLDRLGNTNGAVGFNGSNAYVQLPSGVVNNLGSGTLSFWVRPRQGRGVLTAKQHNSGGQFAFTALGQGKNSDGSLFADVPWRLFYYAKNSSPALSSSNVLAADMWNHVAIVFGPASAQLYLDGLLDAQCQGDFSLPSDDNAFSLGKWLGDGTGYAFSSFNGDLDSVRIHNRALSGSEIQFLYSLEKSWPPAVRSQPANQEVYAGYRADFLCRVAGTAPLAYQWYESVGTNGPWSAISGATNTTLTFSNCSMGMNGNAYLAVASNSLGAVTSQVATLSVKSSFSFSNQVAYYPFDGNANDLSGKGNHGTVNGAVLTPDRFGHTNAAFYFTGTNSDIGFSTVPLTQTNNWSISAWVRSDALSQLGVAVLLGTDNGSSGNGYGFGQSSGSSTAGSKLCGLFAGVSWIDSSYVFTSTNQWHQVILSRDSATLRFYLDAVAMTNTSSLVPLVPTSFRIGSANGLRYFRGAIDEVRIFSQALSAEDAQQLYALEIRTEPVIAAQPQDRQLYAGSNANFRVSAWGTAPLAYQWYEVAAGTGLPAAITGATNPALQILNSQLAQNGNGYYVVLTNPLGATTSRVATLTVSAASEFKGLVAYYPFNKNANEATGLGEDGQVAGVSLTADRFGRADGAYAFSGNNYIGFTNSPLAQNDNWSITAWLRPASLNQLGTAIRLGSSVNGFALLVEDSSGFSGGKLWAELPQVGSVASGYAFTSTSQWHHVAMLREAGVLKFYVDGVQTANTSAWVPYVPTGFRLGADSGGFQGALDEVRVYNRALSAQEVQGLFALETQNEPVIWSQPTNQVVFAGFDAAFGVQVWETWPVSYQWCVNGIALPNATNNTLSVLSCQTNQNGDRYTVVLTNVFGVTTSQVATLSVTPMPLPAFVVQPQTANLPVGGSNSFFVVATNPLPIFYQWYFMGAAIDGATSTNLTFVTVNTNQMGPYYVVASNAVGATTSLVANLVVLVPGDRYVSPNSPNPTVPYDTWDTAAHTLQEAVDATLSGSTVWVTNGFYNAGGRAVYGTMTNRLAIPAGVRVQSLNGPAVTWIAGTGIGTSGTNNGDGAIRCAYLGTNAVLAGFTLTNGHTRASGDSVNEQSGGGLWCATNSVATNCVLAKNGAVYRGGGAYYGTLNNCTLVANLCGTGGGAAYSVLNGCLVSGNRGGSSTTYGGGAYYGWLNNCVVYSNSAYYGGGTYYGTLRNCTLALNSASGYGGGCRSGSLTNCIVYYNTAPSSSNYYSATLANSCSFPLASGTGNISNAPAFANLAGGDLHLVAASGCIDGGSDAAVPAGWPDLDGQPRIQGVHVDMGAYETSPAPWITVQPKTQGFTVGAGATLNLSCVGALPLAYQWFKSPLDSNQWTAVIGATNASLAFASLAMGDMADYQCLVTNNYGAATSQVASLIFLEPGTRYVSVSSLNPRAPYTSWDTAARNIQDAVDLALSGDTVLVADGVYNSGGRAIYDVMTNRVTLDKAVTVKSVNGPSATFIVGNPGFTGDFTVGAVRCAYVGTNALLSGFTLTNGHTISVSSYKGFGGGGALCETNANSVISNCVITGNAACTNGGGVYCGVLKNCIVSGNSASAGNGGAGFGAFMHNCLVVSNSAYRYGGGLCFGAVNNCTVVNNAASASGGGTYYACLTNSILYFNSAPGSTNYYPSTASNIRSCCADPAPIMSTSSFGSDPAFVNPGRGDFRLLGNSPCVDKGYDNVVDINSIDLSGAKRIFGTHVDVGAYEYQGTPAIVSQPLSQTNAVGTTLNVSLVAAGPGPLAYQWFFSPAGAGQWSLRSGLTNAWFRIGTSQFSDAGDYQCVVNNAYGAATSAVAAISVVVPVTHYVATDSPNPTAPYTSWDTAAHVIQDAVDAASPADIVLVNDGVYSAGGRAVYGTMTNRVVLTAPITLQSVHGAAATFIVGAGAGSGNTNGDGAVRCVYATADVVLNGFTLTNGHTRFSGDVTNEQSGGGLWCGTSTNLVITNCVLTGNSAAYRGGGSYRGVLNNCTLMANSLRGPSYGYGGGAAYGTLNNCVLASNVVESASPGYGGGSYYGTLRNCALVGNVVAGPPGYGGGSYYGKLYNCTLTGNWASERGGGSYNGSLTNCIIYYNNAPSDTNYYSGTFGYCCSTPLPSGQGNIEANPLLVSAYHLSAASPCIGQGNFSDCAGRDIDGEAWQNPSCIGADQYTAGGALGAMGLAISPANTNVTVGYPMAFALTSVGILSRGVWDFGDGVTMTNAPYVTHAWGAAGNYQVTFTGYNDSNPNGVSAVATVSVVAQQVYYVNASNSTPVFPYADWATAATNIQEAINASDCPGRLVLVTNGVYDTGGTVVYGSMINRVVLRNGVQVQSVQGPDATWIVGAPGLQGTNGNGDGAIRCVNLEPGSVLSGFTLTNGHTRATNDFYREESGGGAWLAVGAVLTNCVLAGNTAGYGGGAAYGGTLNNCTLRSNSACGLFWAYGGATYWSTLNNCGLSGNAAFAPNSPSGGAVYYGTLNHCSLTSNQVGGASSTVYGGASYYANLNDCILTGNIASGGASDGYGGASYYGGLNRCVLTGNLATGNYGRGGGSYYGTLYNCVLAGNSAVGASYAYGGGSHYGTLNNCTLAGNLASAPTAIYGGGAYSGTLNNCIVYYNKGGTNLLDATNSNFYVSTLNYSCTLPLPTNGIANITNAPGFIDQAAGNFHLADASPCIDAGDDQYAPAGGLDLDGRLRVLGARVDMGAFEYGIPGAPTILLQPQSCTNLAESVAAFALTSTGTAPLTYQWLHADNAIPGGTNSSLIITNLQMADAGAYWCVVANGFGSVTSAVATLTLLPTNHPPVLGVVPGLMVNKNTAITLDTIKLLVTAYDVDGDVLAVSSVDSASAQGGAVGLTNGFVTYIPPTGYLGGDSFNYFVTDGSNTVAGVVAVTVQEVVVSQNQLSKPVLLSNGTLQLKYGGVLGVNYQLQRATNLVNPVWENIGIQSPLPNGVILFTDTNPPPLGFYRTQAIIR